MSNAFEAISAAVTLLRDQAILPIQRNPAIPLQLELGSSERLYTGLLLRDVGGANGCHQVISSHLNGMAILCVHPHHAVFQAGGGVKAVTFQLPHVLVEGKKKKNAVRVNSKTVICKLESNRGTTYDVLCCLHGGIYELNICLETKPSMINEDPLGAGFIALMMPRAKDGHLLRECIRSLGVEVEDPDESD
ncbi:unnamed protein product [Chrysoparadoxa australica]